MAVNTAAYHSIKTITDQKNATLVAVSKFKSIDDIRVLYDLGQRDFGENFVQELATKYEALPKDIRWHFIGHLQRNKVKYIAPFIHLIHGVDTEKLLAEINKEGIKNNRVIDCLLQMHIAEEETKFGFDEDELRELTTRILDTNSTNYSEGTHSTNYTNYTNIAIRGLMGMASFTENQDKIRNEFKKLHNLYSTLNLKPSTFNLLSMGMSGDYSIALEEGSNMVRIGSLLFGAR
jgi:pyridoxal phosphate enzyme (YggS family)